MNTPQSRSANSVFTLQTKVDKTIDHFLEYVLSNWLKKKKVIQCLFLLSTLLLSKLATKRALDLVVRTTVKGVR